MKNEESCWFLTLQIISYQIKDNMCNHGSIGLFGNGVFCGKFCFGRFGLFLSYFFCLARRKRDAGTKIWLVTKKGSFMCFKSWFLFFYFLLVTTLYIIQTLSDPTTFLYISLCFLLISDREFFIFLAFLQSLIGDFLFLFCFLKHIHK